MSTPTTPAPTAEKELALLEAVELKLAVAATDAQFAQVVAQFLCPLLRKLTSPFAQTQQKVLGLCGHVSKRVRGKSGVLPLNDLVALYSEATNNLLISITLMYIEMAIESIGSAGESNNELVKHCFTLARNISARIPAHQQILFHIITPILAAYQEKRSFKPTDAPPFPIDPFRFESDHSQDYRFLLTKWSDFILYSVPPAATPAAEVFVASGLSRVTTLFLTKDGKAKWARNSIEVKTLKAGIIRFLQLEAMVPQNLFAPIRFAMYLAGSTDPAHEVSGAAEDALKRMAKPSFDDPEVVALLYQLYQGTQNSSAPDDAKRSPGNNAVKLKVLGILNRSVKGANEFPGILQVSFDALYGENTTSKLRNAAVGFIQWIARMAEPAKIKPVAPILLSGLLKLIQDSETNESDKELESLRGFAYEAVGLLSKRAPENFVNDISILKSFFKAVSSETRNVRVSVQEALSTMIEAYRNIAKESEDARIAVEEILLENIEKNEHQARYAAVKYANALFEFSNPLARYLNLVASADSKLEVKEEARRGLEFPSPPSPDSTPEQILSFRAGLPSLKDLASFLQTMERKPRLTSRAPGVKYVGSFSAEAYSHALEFLRKVMIAHADPFKKVEEGFRGGIAEEENGAVGSRISDLDTRANVKTYLKTAWAAPGSMAVDGAEGGVAAFLDLVERGLKNEETDAVLQSTASSCLIELISLCPSSLAESYRDKADWVKTFLSSLKSETRQCMARVLGIISTSDLSVGDRAQQFNKLIEELSITARDTSKQTSFESRNGSVLALGFILGRLRYRYSETWTNYLDQSAANKIVAIVAEELDSTSALHIQGACISLSEIARYGALPVLIGQEDATSPMEVDGIPKPAVLVAASLFELGKSTKETKLQEAAIAALGQLALGTPAVAETILDFFYTLPSILSKHVEVNFTVGDAICAAAGGFKATSLEESLDIADVEFPPVGTTISTPDPSIMEKVLERCFHEIRPGGIPVSKKAVCVWLLSLVKFCGAMSQIKNNLPKMHTAFSNLISDRDEFTQEVASKGIGLVYELGDATIKASLVESLVSTFTEGKKIAPQSITGDTTLFQEGSLGQTPDGTNLTTYQSILSLASDLNQPDLVYKFMSLASHNAIWNSRRGASMGFGSIASLAERELAPYLSQIVPKLYRFQFDPNVKVAESMKSIWRSLVKDPKKAVDDHFDVIIKDLLKGLGDRMWRTRESSCLALSDILHGRQLVQLQPYLQEIWAMCFRALDDIKESVRVAAFATCKTLTNVTVKYCDPTVVSVSQGQAIMDIVMPFFLTKGLGSKAEDVAKFSLATVLKITKKGGVLLKPHLTELISTLLESLSSLEPQALSYLTFHTDKYGITQEQLDSSRLSAAKSSPMMEAVDSCVENLDASVMETLMPKVFNIIRRGVGLPTKAGSARFVVTLAMRVPSDLRPHADSTLKALSGAITDRSPAVRKTFATAIGHIAKLCTVSALQRFINHIRSMYTDSEEEDTRTIVGITVLEISRYSSDAFANLNAEILPLAFLGRRDANEGVKTTWTEVWDENTAGASGAVKLYLSELMTLCTTLLGTTPSWGVKKQVGLALGDIAKAIGAGIVDRMDTVLPMLIEALGGRTWDGKESVLEALVTVSIEGKSYFETNKDQLEAVTKVVIREAKKNNKPYKRVALEYLGRYVDALKVDKYDELEDYLIEMATVDGDDDDDDPDDIRTKPMNLAIRANAYKGLGLCWPVVKTSQEKWANEVLPQLIKGLDGNVWNTRIAILEAIERIFQKCETGIDSTITEQTILTVIAGTVAALMDGKYSAVREQSLKVVKQLVERIKDTKLLTDSTRTVLISGLDEAIAKELISSILEPLKDIRKEISGMSLD
ncbi:proteasome stabiliser-domain-containing protein [Obelidium mucronatum]|nr:proteasome stabiliser-domain-containing protein [Obelidium mucronatum]